MARREDSIPEPRRASEWAHLSPRRLRPVHYHRSVPLDYRRVTVALDGSDAVLSWASREG